MLIAIDYDDTFTADPEFWRLMIEAGQKRGHRFVIVTAKDRDEFAVDIDLHVADVVGENMAKNLVLACTNGMPKRRFLAQCGYRPNVWIDDLPESVGMPTLAAINQVHVKGK